VQPDQALARLRRLGFSEEDAGRLFAHFDDAERRGKLGHGYARIEWLETFPDLNPGARPAKVESRAGFDRWDGQGALGYLTLAAICDDLERDPPDPARVVVASRCFPTGMLGHYARRLAEAGLVAVLTATSPARLAHPDGGEPLVGTNPLTIGIPSAEGRPIVVDVSPAKATWGDVIAGRAREEDVVPFGGERAHKAFALAVGLQLLVESFADGYGAFLVVARPDRDDAADRLRDRATGTRLPGDS
jgi:LDH2 family malate/lactate/ureidoglycolate dehydrogenase